MANQVARMMRLEVTPPGPALNDLLLGGRLCKLGTIYENRHVPCTAGLTASVASRPGMTGLLACPCPDWISRSISPIIVADDAGLTFFARSLFSSRPLPRINAAINMKGRHGGKGHLSVLRALRFRQDNDRRQHMRLRTISL